MASIVEKKWQKIYSMNLADNSNVFNLHVFKKTKSEQSLGDIWNTIKSANVYVIKYPKERRNWG